MKRTAALLVLTGAMAAAGCVGRCNVMDGCASWTSDRARGEPLWPTKVVPIEPAGLASALKAGDRVHLETVEGKLYRLRVESLHPQSFWARAGDGKVYEVRYDRVRRLGIVREKDGADYFGDFVWGVVTASPAPLPHGAW